MLASLTFNLKAHRYHKFMIPVVNPGKLQSPGCATPCQMQPEGKGVITGKVTVAGGKGIEEDLTFIKHLLIRLSILVHSTIAHWHGPQFTVLLFEKDQSMQMELQKLHLSSYAD